MSLGNNNHIRVAMLVASLPPLPSGGAEMQALKLGRELSNKNISVFFFTPGKKNVSGETTIDGMPVQRLHSWMNGLFQFLAKLKKGKQQVVTKIEYDDAKEVTDQINRKVGLSTVVYYNIFFFHALFFLWSRRRTFDIIHAHTMEWSAIVAARLGQVLGKPVLIKESTMNGFQSLSRFPSGKNLQQMIMQRAHFVAMTKIIYENLVKSGIVTDRITRIPNGIAITEKSKKIISNDSKPRILFVGNLYQQPAKGIDILLKAWQRVNRQFPEAVLQIVGDGVTQAYKDFVDQLELKNSVEFHGKQTDIKKYYASADIFVLPSRREGMSNALMEAMLHEIPCVATNISGSQDLITDKMNGILVPSTDIETLADAICYMLKNPEIAGELGRKGRDTILREFNISTVAEKYISLYDNLTRKNK